MYSATIDLVAECQKWLRNVAYVKFWFGLGGLVAISRAREGGGGSI